MKLLTLDQTLTGALYELTRHNIELQGVIYITATYLIFLLPMALLHLAWKPNTRLLAAKIFVFALITWQIISKFAGEFFYFQYGFRDRPFAFSGLRELLFEQPQKSFPSDHAAVLLFVTLALFRYRQTGWAWVFLAVTILSSVARAAVGFHWVGDIIGGWLVALLGFGLMIWLEQPFQKLRDRIAQLFDARSRG